MSTENSYPELEEHSASSVAKPLEGQTAKQGPDISLFDLLLILIKRIRLIIFTTAVCTIVALVVSLLLPKKYAATVTLLPPQHNSSMAAALSSQLGSLGNMSALAGAGLGLKNPNDQFVGMLKSRTVEDAMVQHFDLMQEYGERYPSDARKDFEKAASIDGSGKDGLIYITVEARNPQHAADMANAYVDQFRRLTEHLAITEASQRRLFFEGQLEHAKENLVSAEEALKRTEQATGVIQLDSQSRALIESAASLRAEISAREVQIQGMQTYATSENAQLVQAQRELESLRGQLTKLGGSEEGGSGELLVSRGRVPEAGLEYVRKLRDVKYNETIFEILARQFEMAKLDEAKQGALVQVVDAAIPPDKRSSPKRALITIGSTVLGFFLGIFLALMQAALEHLKNDPGAIKIIDHFERAVNPKIANSASKAS